MIAADLHGHITAWNLAAARLFGAGELEMMGASWDSIVPIEDRERATAMFEASLTQGKASEFEFSLRNEHGAERRLAVVVTPVADPDGKRIGGMACVRDITNRMILQEQLSQQTKMASLGEMAGAISHHFNNILGGIVTSIDFALASADPDMMEKVLAKTAQALPRATELIRSLLAFAEGDYQESGMCDLGLVLI